MHHPDDVSLSFARRNRSGRRPVGTNTMVALPPWGQQSSVLPAETGHCITFVTALTWLANPLDSPALRRASLGRRGVTVLMSAAS